MTGPRSWKEQAKRLDLAVETRETHLTRWKEALRLQGPSVFTQSLALPTPYPLLPALDAAVGIADEVGRLQTEYLGKAWEQRVSTFTDLVESLRLPDAPPPGTPLRVWTALRTIYDTPGYEKKLKEKDFREELALTDRFREEHPQDWERMVSYAETLGEALDVHERPHAEAQKHDLDTGTAFRTAWLDVYPDTRPGRAASKHLAVAILDLVFSDVRPTALFLDHCGVLTASLAPEGNPERIDDLKAIDNEVRNARKAWKRLGHQGGPTQPSIRLISVVESLAAERLRSSDPVHAQRPADTGAAPA